MTVRQIIADQIKTDNPNFIVDQYPHSYPDNLGRGRTYVQVTRTSLERTAKDLVHHMEIVVMVAKQEGDKAEDDLEGSLDDVLLSLERLGLPWSDATRITLHDKWNAYAVSVDVPSDNIYKTAVLTTA